MANIAVPHRRPQLGGSGRHKTWTYNEDNKQGPQHPTGRKIPNGAQTATQSDMGADLGESPGQANEVEAFDSETGEAHRNQAQAMYMEGAHQNLVWVA
jgi:hypothetical protein